MTPSNLLGAHAHRLLADGKWHNRHDIISALARRVPPGYASRAAARAREADAKWRQRALGRTDAKASDGRDNAAAAVERGAKITARRVLESKDYQHRTLEDGTRQVRLARS